MLVVDVLDGWRPGSYDPPWSWADERADLAARAELDPTWTGQPSGPITLGPDGRVWDGHHRLLAASLYDTVEVLVVEV